MPSNAKRNRQAVGFARGVSIVEFVGCLAAMGGGIVLGSMYLGVDVKAMAVGLLEKADLEVPAILDDDAPAAPAPVEDATADDSAGQTPTDEFATFDSDAESGETSADAATTDEEPAIETPELRELTDAEQLVATKACWTALNTCMQQESSNRSKSIRDPGSWQLFDYLLHRKDGHQLVLESIDLIDLNGVDPRLESHLKQVLSWHRSGADLFERAAFLLTDAPAGKLSGPFAQSWQSAATQHRMEEKLILNKHSAVASYLEHTHKGTSADNATN